MTRMGVAAAALAAIAANASAQQAGPDPFQRNAAIRDAAFYVEAVAQTLESKAAIADRIADLARRAGADRFGASKLQEQALRFIVQFDALGRDMATGRRNLIAPGASDWRADLVEETHTFRAERLDAATLGLSQITLTDPAAAAPAVERAEIAAERLRAARDRYRADVQAILEKRLEEPEPPEPQTETLAEGGPADGGLMSDIINRYSNEP